MACCDGFWDKDPADVADFGFDWSPILDEGDAIASQTVVVDYPDPGVDDLDVYDPAHSDTATVFWARFGVDRRRYPVTITIVTAGGRTWEETHDFVVHEM